MARRWVRSLILPTVALTVLVGCTKTSDTVTGPLPTATFTPQPGAPTMTPTTTPTPGVATPTQTPVPTAAVINVGQDGGTVFVDQQSGTSTTNVAVGTTVQWIWVSGFHSTTSGACSVTCTPDGLWDSGAGIGLTFSKTFSQAGTFPYFCNVHGAMMTGTVVVQ